MTALQTMQKLIAEWGVRCFGEQMHDSRLRSLRLTEEVIELAQALGVDQAKMHLLVDTVYSRPVGYAEQEIGGVLLTTVALCETKNWDVEERLLAELSRVLAKSVEHFSGRNQEKLSLGFN